MQRKFHSIDFSHRGDSNVNTSHFFTTSLEVSSPAIVYLSLHSSPTLVYNTALRHFFSTLFYNTSLQQSSPTLPHDILSQHFPATAFSDTFYNPSVVYNTLLHSLATLKSNALLQRSSAALLSNTSIQNSLSQVENPTTLLCNTLPLQFPLCSTTPLYKTFSDTCLQHVVCSTVFSNIFLQPFCTPLIYDTFLQNLSTTLLHNSPLQHFSTTPFPNTSLQLRTLILHRAPKFRIKSKNKKNSGDNSGENSKPRRENKKNSGDDSGENPGDNSGKIQG